VRFSADFETNRAPESMTKIGTWEAFSVSRATLKFAVAETTARSILASDGGASQVGATETYPRAEKRA
jgi:hypothetical protein